MTAPILNRPGWTTQIVTVAAAGTPVQGPSIIIPHGFGLAITQRVHAGAPTGYLAISSAAALVDATRKELKDGQGLVLYVTNADLVWFDASASATVFELTVEQ